MNKKNLNCECGLHWAWFYFTNDKKQIDEEEEEQNEKQLKEAEKNKDLEKRFSVPEKRSVARFKGGKKK